MLHDVIHVTNAMRANEMLFFIVASFLITETVKNVIQEAGDALDQFVKNVFLVQKNCSQSRVTSNS